MPDTSLVTDNLHLRIFVAHWTPIDTTWNTPNVRNAFWRFYWNEEAGASVRIGETLLPLDACRAYFIPAGVQFTCHNVRRLLHFFVHFDVIGLHSPAMRALFADAIALPESPVQQETILRLKSEMSPATPLAFGTQCRIKALLFEELGNYWRSLPLARLEQSGQWTQRLQPVLPALERIEADFAMPLSIETLARECAMSVNHFIRQFRQCVGTTPAQYVQEKRIGAASQQLLFTQASIEAIAEQNGFANRFYFSRVFARHTGVSPAAYRRTAHR